MELWFWAAVGGAICAGVSNFCFKIAAKRNFNSELFSFYGGVTSVIFALVLLLLIGKQIGSFGFVPLAAFASGVVASTGGIMKPYALRHIDTTLFFPLFKLLSPLLAIFAGMVFFSESFSSAEWIGIVLSLTVPLLLINKIEHGRQANLVAGLILIAAVSFTSASAAALNKWAIELELPVLTSLFYSSVGILLGSVVVLMGKRGVHKLFYEIAHESAWQLVLFGSLRAVLISASLGLVLYAFKEGSLGVVQTIHSLYIIIPIALSIMFYHEHWNARKVLAIVLSVAALGFFH